MISKAVRFFSRLRIIRRALIRLFVKIDNLSYVALTQLAIQEEGGTHPKHRIMAYHEFFLSHIAEGDCVIDIGCGKGETAHDVGKKAHTVIGIDMNADVIAYAKKKWQRSNVTYLLGDATTYPFEDRFDKIVLSNVLEHIEDRVSFLKRLHPLSDTLLLRVPMIDRDWLTIFKKEQGLEYRLDPTHYIEFTLSGLKKEVREGGWKIDSFSVQFGEFWGVLTLDDAAKDPIV